jgi:hypothetical protein
MVFETGNLFRSELRNYYKIYAAYFVMLLTCFRLSMIHDVNVAIQSNQKTLHNRISN